METIEKQVKRVVAEQLGLQPIQVQGASDFLLDLGADSLDRVEILMALEDKFWIEIPEVVAEGCTTVQDAINVITRILEA